MKKIALVIGHNNIAKGAYSKYLEMAEYDYWNKVCDEINKIDENIDIYNRAYNKSYKAQMLPVVKAINDKRYDFILELHFNSGGEGAKGSEFLVHPKSEKAKNIAQLLINHLNKYYSLKLRGNKGIYEVGSENDRGGYGIYNTLDPYILIEPFFGSSEESLQFKDIKKLARVLVEFINKE